MSKEFTFKTHKSAIKFLNILYENGFHYLVSATSWGGWTIVVVTNDENALKLTNLICVDPELRDEKEKPNE